MCQAVGPFETDVVKRSSALNLEHDQQPEPGQDSAAGLPRRDRHRHQAGAGQAESGRGPERQERQADLGAIGNAFAQLDTTMSSAVSQAQALPTNSATSFKAAAQKLGTTVRSSMASIGTNLQSGT